MSTAAIFIAIAIVLMVLVAVVFAFRNPVRSLTQTEGRDLAVRPIDVAALRNLLDPAEEMYLRSRLPKSHFRPIQRQRMLAGLEYLQAVSRDAAILIAIGRTAQLNADPRVAERGRALAQQAIQLRIATLQASIKLALAIVLPVSYSRAASLADGYERVTHEGIALKVTSAAI